MTSYVLPVGEEVIEDQRSSVLKKIELVRLTEAVHGAGENHLVDLAVQDVLHVPAGQCSGEGRLASTWRPIKHEGPLRLDGGGDGLVQGHGLLAATRLVPKPALAGLVIEVGDGQRGLRKHRLGLLFVIDGLAELVEGLPLHVDVLLHGPGLALASPQSRVASEPVLQLGHVGHEADGVEVIQASERRPWGKVLRALVLGAVVGRLLEDADVSPLPAAQEDRGEQHGQAVLLYLEDVVGPHRRALVLAHEQEVRGIAFAQSEGHRAVPLRQRHDRSVSGEL